MPSVGWRSICQKAATDDALFRVFKSHSDVTPTLEHVPEEHGIIYLKDARRISTDREWLDLLDRLSMASRNDSVGQPGVAEINVAPHVPRVWSPTTLRYVWVERKLSSLFPDAKTVIEFGGGYGGQCYVSNCFRTYSQWHLIDFPETAALQKRYLDTIMPDHRNVLISSLSDFTHNGFPSDVLVSNFALCEVPENEDQAGWLDMLLSVSKCGFLMCNDRHDHRMIRLLNERGIEGTVELEPSVVHNYVVWWRR